MGESLDVDYSGNSSSGAVVNLFLGMHSRLGNYGKCRSNRMSPASLQLLERRLPSSSERSLEMQRLNARQGNRTLTRQEASCARACCEILMRFECTSKPQLFARLRLSHGDEFAMQNFIYFGAKSVGEAPGHPRSKIQPERAEHHNDAAGHVFAAMLANTFDDRQRTAVTNRKALPGAPGDVQLPGSRAIQNSVPGEH